MRRRVWEPEEAYFLRDLRRRRTIEDIESRCAATVRQTLQAFVGELSTEATKHRMEAAVRTILRAFQKEAEEKGLRGKDGLPYKFKIKGEITFNGGRDGQ